MKRNALGVFGYLLAIAPGWMGAWPATSAEFADPMDILRATEDGTFAERAGLTDELEALRVPPPPPPLEIEFVHGTRVPDAELQELRELADALARNEAVIVDIVGCSDPSGPAALNEKISQGRAESVAAALEDLGISRTRFREIVGRGESCEIQERAVHILPALPEA